MVRSLPGKQPGFPDVDIVDGGGGGGKTSMCGELVGQKSVAIMLAWVVMVPKRLVSVLNYPALRMCKENVERL